MNQETLYWLFSTIAQAYGAIVGIVGLLVVYRLDNQNRLRGSIRARLIDPPRSFLPLQLSLSFEDPRPRPREEVYGWSPEDISDHIHKFDNNVEEDKAFSKLKRERATQYKYLIEEVSRIDNSVELCRAIRIKFTSFIKLHIPLIIVSILAIYLIPIVPFPLSLHSIKGLITYEFFIFVSVVLALSTKMIWSMAMTLIDEQKGGQ